LRELDLKGPRVDFEERCALADGLAFFVRHRRQLTVDARFDRDRVQRCDRSEAGDVHTDVSLAGRSGDDRNRRGGTTALALLRIVAQPEEGRRQPSGNEQSDHGDPPAPFWGGRGSGAVLN